jgi:anti-sigma B factor antagonist
MSLTINVDASDPVRVHLKGRLDGNTAPALDQHLDAVLAAGPRAVVFELAQLEYISSAGLRCVVRVKKAMAQSGGQMLMVNLQPTVQKVFDVVKAVAGQNIFRNVKELDAYLDALQKKVRDAGA